jgi:hypothetical protein
MERPKGPKTGDTQMKPIKIATAATLMALTPIAAQAAMPMIAPMSVPAPIGGAGQVQPVFLDLQQLERDMLVLLHGTGGNGGDSDDRSRDGNSDDDNDDNGGNSGGGNGGNS